MKRKQAVVFLLALLLLLLPLVGCQRTAESALRVCVLDVGQSDCILLSQGEKHMLIDTGCAASRDTVLGVLAAQGVKELEYLLVTHPHEDHYGNARMLLETRPVGTLMISELPSEELGYRMVLDAAKREGVQARRLQDGERFSFGDATVDVFCALPDDKEGNNASLVVKVCFGNVRFLFMGDAEKDAEEILLARDADWKCDFLKVGHHGSNTSSSTAFLRACQPEMAIISCGKDNEYGFPHREVLAELDHIGARLYRTDTLGHLYFTCDGERILYGK